MQTYIVSANGAATGDGSEGTPFATMDQAEKVAKPGDTVMARGTIKGVAKWNKPGMAEAPITIVSHPDGGNIDGGYTLPTGKAEFVGPTGLERVDKPLVLVDASHVIWSVDITRSRGRGVQFGLGKKRVTGSALRGAKLTGIRAAPIDIRGADNIVISDNTTRDTGNYNTTVRDTTAYNVSGCIKTLNSTDIVIENNDISQHYGNVLTPSRLTVGIKVLNNRIWDCAGSLIYVHFAQDVLVQGNVLWYGADWTRIHDGIVVNNEEEFTAEGSKPGTIRIVNNTMLGVRNGIAMWANEGTGIVTDGIEVSGNTVINPVEAALLVRDGRLVKGMTVVGNRFSSVAGKLLDVRQASGNVVFGGNGYSGDVEAWAKHANDWKVPTVGALKADSADEVLRLAKVVADVDVDVEEDEPTDTAQRLAALETALATMLANQDAMRAEWQTFRDGLRSLVG